MEMLILKGFVSLNALSKSHGNLLLTSTKEAGVVIDKGYSSLPIMVLTRLSATYHSHLSSSTVICPWHL